MICFKVSSSPVFMTVIPVMHKLWVCHKQVAVRAAWVLFSCVN